MPLVEVRIDERTWEQSSEARRLEWQAAIDEMLQPGEVVIRGDASRLVVSLTQQHFHLQLQDSADRPVATVEITHDRLGDLITEYIDTVRQIANTQTVARLEALDMAKKATHDRAGRLVKRLCREFEIDHPTARRLFSLLLTLKVDTTRLVGVHAHRRIR